jgi:hypothetical protein
LLRFKLALRIEHLFNLNLQGGSLVSILQLNP